ncbi:MAG: uracil-DNA glycosylase family protein [Rhodospirillales bacterium]|nr:uracil-DNA glycosylase family protein [Rhodospirillales bacterium]
MKDLTALLNQVRACDLCRDHLPLGPRPTLRASGTARLLIIGQAPGTRVHETGVPWNDRSGDRLRAWMGIGPERFYDESRIAIVPVGFCYPGRDKNGGDKPPRPECAPHWHPRLLPALTQVRLTLLVGSYAQAYVLKEKRRKSLTETVQAWRDYLPETFVLPHPSWRNTAWLRKNPWFEEDLVPHLQRRVRLQVADEPEIRIRSTA